MKRVAVLLLAFAMGLTWFLLQGRGTAPSATREATDPGRAKGSEAGPGLAAGRAPTLRATPGAEGGPPERGTSGIVGIVRRGAMPTAAKVELRWIVSNREYERGQRGGGATLARALELRAPAAPTRTASSGEDGRVTFDAIPAGVWELDATAADGARGSARVQVIREGARVEVEISLFVATETLDGRVLYEDGRPWTGVVLVAPYSLMRFDEVYLPEASGTLVSLDGEGRFHAVALPRGRAVVMALAAGSLRVGGMVIPIPYEGEYVLRVPLPGSVVGRVVADADGSGISGAEVFGTGMAGDRLALVYGRAVTDANGAFALALPGSGTLSARADGYAGTSRPYADSPLEIRLLRPARLEGRVAAARTSAGVPGVAVTLRPPPDRHEPDRREDATSDAEGHYAFDGLEPGQVLVLASGAGWITRGASEVRLDGANPFLVRLEAGKTTALDLVVTDGAVISGRVLDPESRPVGGALVRARMLTHGGNELLGQFEGRGESVATDANGAFRLDTLVRGSAYGLSAEAPGFASAVARATTSEDESVPSVDLRLDAARTVVVTVQDDAQGTPIPAATVTCTMSLGGGISIYGWITGPEGRVAISPLGAVGVHVNARADGYLPGGQVLVPVTQTEAVVRLRPGLDIAGRVVAPDGTPAPGARIRCIPPESEVTTRPDGTFRVRGLAAGLHHLQAEAPYPRSLTASASVEAGRTDVVLTLAAPSKDEPSRTLTVRVVDSKGAPVPGAYVDFSWTSVSGDGSSSTGREAVDGVAQFADIANRGEGTIRVSGARARDGSALPLGPATLEHVAATASQIVVTLPVGFSISGRVLGPTGRGVPGASVRALSDEAMRRWGARSVDDVPGGASVARTEADGTFRLDGLADATYTLVLAVPPDLVRPEPVRAGAGREDVEITLKAGVVATIRVVDTGGTPVADAPVGLDPVGAQGTAPWLSMRTLGNGTARFPSLDPAATYRLVVQVPSTRPELLAPMPIEPWIPHDDVVRLSVAGAVRGVVLDTEGKAVPGATVWWTQGETTQGPGLVQAGEDGTFEISHLPTGSIRLRAELREGTPMGLPSVAPTWTEVSTAGDKVNLKIDLGLALDVVVENWPQDDTGRRQPVQARLWAEDATPGSSVAFAYLGPDGRVRFRGLRPDRKYTLWVDPVGDSSVLERGLVAGREARVRLVPGGSITVRLQGVPSRATWTGVSAEADGLVVQGEKQADGRYRIRALPERRWTVRAYAGGENLPQLRAEAEASTGAEVTLTLQAAPPPR